MATFESSQEKFIRVANAGFMAVYEGEGKRAVQLCLSTDLLLELPFIPQPESQ